MTEFKNWKKWESKNKDSWFCCVPGKNGFLPIEQPLYRLPEKYDKVNEILKKMKITQSDGSNGYLHDRILGEIIDKELPIYNVSSETDVKLLAALQRDYYFLASAYSLETSHPQKNESIYKQARTEIPPQISIPLLELSKKNKVFPWLDYAYGYGLNNAILVGDDPTHYGSYKTVRTFNGSQSEEGFINVHVAMVAQSGKLLEHQQESLYNIHVNDRDKFNYHLKNHYNIFSNIIQTLQTMWQASSYNDYLTFRTFIMAQKGNKICYPEETIKFNIELGSEIHSYRGETGAQDSIIPSVDSFLLLDYPQNKLTEYLFDLRKYRPIDHQEYINFVNNSSKELKFKDYCYKDSYSCILLLKNLNCLRMFRKKHWNLTKKYIIENTKHPVATGGTPITTWLPNQLGATLAYMQEVIDNIKVYELESEDDIDYYNSMKVELSDHIQSIMDEVSSMQRDFKNQDYNDFVAK